jgi:hypothetical protein
LVIILSLVISSTLSSSFFNSSSSLADSSIAFVLRPRLGAIASEAVDSIIQVNYSTT